VPKSHGSTLEEMRPDQLLVAP